jgi:hypothetical protein
VSGASIRSLPRDWSAFASAARKAFAPTPGLGRCRSRCLFLKHALYGWGRERVASEPRRDISKPSFVQSPARVEGAANICHLPGCRLHVHCMFCILICSRTVRLSSGLYLWALSGLCLPKICSPLRTGTLWPWRPPVYKAGPAYTYHYQNRTGWSTCFS